MAGKPFTALRERLQRQMALDTVELPSAARSHAHTRERILARIDAISYQAQTAGQYSAALQAEVKIGEHLGMWTAGPVRRSHARPR